MQLLQDTGVPLAQVSEQSGGEKGSRDFFIRNFCVCVCVVGGGGGYACRDCMHMEPLCKCPA